MGNFRLRLVIYFVALSLVPLAGATWAFSETAKRSELRQVDASLGKSLRGAAGRVAAILDSAEGEAVGACPDAEHPEGARD